MTLHQLFDLSTMEHRHLVLSYAVIILLQGGYLAWVLRSSSRLRGSRRP